MTNATGVEIFEDDTGSYRRVPPGRINQNNVQKMDHMVNSTVSSYGKAYLFFYHIRK